MSTPTDELERRVATALRAEVDHVSPSDGSLGTIRGRVRAARQRRRLVAAGVGTAAVLVAAVAVPLLRGDDRDRVSTGNDTAPTTTAPDTTTTVPDTTATTAAPAPPSVDYSQAVWPDPAGQLFTDPVAAARSFVTEVVGIDDPPLSDFVEGPQPGGGTVAVYRVTEDGTPTDRVASDISLRQLDGEHWFVTLATSVDVRIESPVPGDAVPSPFAVTGQGHGYEGTILVQLHDRGNTDISLVDSFVTTAGSGEALEPFTAELGYDDVPSPAGIVLAMDTSGADVAVPAFSAIPVRLSEIDGGSGGGSQTGTGAPSGTEAPTDGSYEFPQAPLWPFRTQAEADAWLAAADQGHQPWHADAEATALAFTQGFLGFTEIDRVTSADVRADEAWIGVGFHGEAVEVTAAVVHLRRFGPSPDAPWEVVGTRDTALTLDTPDYGSTATSPLTVGGAVTDAEGSLTVAVRQPSSAQPLGEVQGVAVAPETTRWRATASYTGATDPALTVVVSLRSDVRDVARFAITAVRP